MAAKTGRYAAAAVRAGTLIGALALALSTAGCHHGAAADASTTTATATPLATGSNKPNQAGGMIVPTAQNASQPAPAGQALGEDHGGLKQ